MISFAFIFLCSTYLVKYMSCGIVSFIDPCSLDDQACILTSSIKALPYIVAGISKLGVPPSDPLIIKNIQALDGDLKLTLNDVKVEGVGKCKLVNVEYNAAKNVINMVAVCPSIVTGTYTVSGKIVAIPVNGNGPFIIKTDKISTKFVMKVDTVERDGKKYWAIVHKSVDFKPIEKIAMNFDNLFNGDKEKAEPLQQLFDQNWYELATTIGKPIIEKVISKEIDNINTFFNNVPLDELIEA